MDIRRLVLVWGGIVVLVAGRGWAEEGTLLKNGDFSAKLEGWGVPSLELANVVEEGGNTFLRVKNETLGGYSEAVQNLVLKEDWTKLKTTVRMRVKSLTLDPNRPRGEVPRVMIDFDCPDAEKTEDKVQHRPICLLTDVTGDTWVTQSETVEIPKYAKSIKFSVNVPGNVGVCDFDDVVLEANAGPGVPMSVLDTAGSFSYRRDVSNRVPVGWLVRYEIRTAEKDLVSVVEENGNRFLRIKNEGDPTTIFIENFFILPQGWKKVEIGAKIRTQGLACGSEVWQDARVMVVFTDKDGKQVGGFGEVPFTKTDQDWKESKAKRDVPEGAVCIKLAPGLYVSKGTADFDDIYVKKIE